MTTKSKPLADITIAIDAMGGDRGPKVVVPGALRMLEKYPELRLIFVGQEAVIRPTLESRGAAWKDRWSIQHASEVVEMDESPSSALRNKKDSAMRVAVNLVKEGVADACVSSGNTGALMATARFVLKTLPGIDRPAITTQFPSRSRKAVRVLDLGANVDSKVAHLYQFAVMGSILARAVDGIENPSVGLLNVGSEGIKGNEQVKAAAELLERSDVVNYIGYVEGGDIFAGNIDIVVCDGFVGNITLKACEGLSKMIGQYMRDSFRRNLYSKLAYLVAAPVLNHFKAQVDPRQHNGAALIGLNGIVVKSHGSAGVVAFGSAIEEALLEVKKNVLSDIREQVASALKEEEGD